MYRNSKRGIKMEQEGPRYSSGYASLFNCYGMITENHVYKPYPDRVKSCYQFITVLAGFTSKNASAIIASRKKGEEELLAAETYPIKFKLDTTSFHKIEFKGYEPDDKQISKLTGLPRFGYDRSKPLTENINFYDVYSPVESVKIPDYYILPQTWKQVVDRLKLTGINFSTLPTDTTLEVTVAYIYYNTEWAEKTYKRLPVAKIFQK